MRRCLDPKANSAEQAGAARKADGEIEERRSLDLMLDHEQTHHVIQALDSYSRIWMGQYSDIAWNLRLIFDLYRLDEKGLDCAIRGLLEAIRALAIPKLAAFSFHGSFGIWSPETELLSGGRACNAYDMQQVIRHAEAWHTHPAGGFGVSFSEPWIRGSLQPLICSCKGESEKSFRMALHLQPEHLELLQEATEAYALLLELRLHDMFELFFDETNTLELASTLEHLLDRVVSQETASLAREEAAHLRRIPSCTSY